MKWGPYGPFLFVLFFLAGIWAAFDKMRQHFGRHRLR
jgi:hypothetical protein